MAKTFVFGKAPKSVKDTELDHLFKANGAALPAAAATESTTVPVTSNAVQDASSQKVEKRAKRNSTRAASKPVEADASEPASAAPDKAPKRRMRSTAKLNDERNERTVFVGNLPSAATVKV
jgi:hypothetical protein